MGGYSVNPLWVSGGGVADCPQGFGNPWDGARATVGREGEGQIGSRIQGYLLQIPSNIPCPVISYIEDQLALENGFFSLINLAS